MPPHTRPVLGPSNRLWFIYRTTYRFSMYFVESFCDLIEIMKRGRVCGRFHSKWLKVTFFNFVHKSAVTRHIYTKNFNSRIYWHWKHWEDTGRNTFSWRSSWKRLEVKRSKITIQKIHPKLQLHQFMHNSCDCFPWASWRLSGWWYRLLCVACTA